jgi:hypothetical protein
MGRLSILVVTFFATISAHSAVPDTKVAAADHGGGSEVLSIHRLPVPKPEAGEALIAVHAAGVGV